MFAHAVRRLALSPAAPRSAAALASTTRRFATDKAPAIALIDPVAIAKELKTESARMPLAKLREMENDLVAKVFATVEPIDWNAWKSEIAYPGLVDEIRAEYEKLPLPNVDAEIAKAEKSVEELFAPALKMCEEVAKDAAAQLADLEVQMKEASYIADNLETMTVDEYLERNPAFKKSVEDDIANNRWFVNQQA